MIYRTESDPEESQLTKTKDLKLLATYAQALVEILGIPSNTTTLSAR